MGFLFSCAEKILLKCKKTDTMTASERLTQARNYNQKHPFVMPTDSKVRYRKTMIEQYPCVIMRPHGGKGKGAVLYIFGGGGLLSAWKPQLAMARKTAQDSGADVWYPIYPLGTEVSLAETLRILTEVYRTMLKKYPAEKIIFEGGSSGASAALALILMNIKKSDSDRLPMPGAVIAHSPSSIPLSEPEWKEMEQKAESDFMCSINIVRNCQELFQLDDDAEQWMISPAHGDYTGAPPLYLFYGGYEMLSACAPYFAESFRKAGITFRIHTEPKMFHCYSMFPVTKKSMKSYYAGIRIIRRIIQSEIRK